MLHESLRDLVGVRGPGVVAEAEELRSALDDFLAEEEASLGEINLLVDAVRLGALRRVLDVIDHGAQPEAAIREAGIGLSRDRGTDDPIRSCWALASLCFALGKIDAGLVRRFGADLGTLPAPTPPTAPHGREPVTAEASASPVTARPTVDVQVPATGGTVPRGPEQATAADRRSSRAGVALLVVLVALILGGLVAAGVILLRSSDGDDATASDDTSSPGGGRQQRQALVPATAMLVAYEVDDEDGAVFQVDTVDGVVKQLSPDGVNARLPSISPDRRSMTYVDFTDVDKGLGVLMLMDLATQEVRPVFDATGPCARALRPGWSLDGSRLAAICADDEGEPTGIYVTDVEGDEPPRLVVDDPLVRGAPTWVSPTEFVYGGYFQGAEGPLGLRLIDTEAGGLPVDVPAPRGFEISFADWSPEIGKLLFLVTEPGGDEEVGSIWTMNANGTGQQPLADGEFLNPVWSVDGGAIGITWYDDSGTRVLAYLDLDDPESVVVVPDPPAGAVGNPVWSTR